MPHPTELEMFWSIFEREMACRPSQRHELKQLEKRLSQLDEQATESSERVKQDGVLDNPQLGSDSGHAGFDGGGNLSTARGDAPSQEDAGKPKDTDRPGVLGDSSD